jgi:hypothetical protein
MIRKLYHLYGSGLRIEDLIALIISFSIKEPGIVRVLRLLIRVI